MTLSASTTGISVIMPVYNQALFLPRAIASLLAQTFLHWELLIINDGSTDNPEKVLQHLLPEKRIRYFSNKLNRGMGASLNIGLNHSQYDLVAYLPADDVYYRDHLTSLWETFIDADQQVLAFSGVQHHYNRSSTGVIDGYPLQLVQVMHLKTSDRWMEREELVTDDLDKMFWSRLRSSGEFLNTGRVSCEWVDHPDQRHKIIQEPIGGINPYKQWYNVNQPLRYHSTKGNFIDERSYYSRFANTMKKDAEKALKILLVGELAYNPERILALEERGHQLYGLWMSKPYWYNYVGPLPFGNIIDIPRSNWETCVREIKPDIIYGLLNWQAVPFCYEVMKKTRGIPFVWHFKEGPFICLEKGCWNELIELYHSSDANIFCSPEMQQWFSQFLVHPEKLSMILDGDLPKKEWFSDDRSALISSSMTGTHTVVPGRPIGLHPQTVEELAKNNIHLHFYGDFTHGQWREWISRTKDLAPDHLHIHSNCPQDCWVKEFSKYDAGWLHFFRSANQGDLMRMNWDDLNIPARMATLATAGLPMIQFDNTGHLVATQTLVKRHDLGIFFRDIKHLAEQLNDKEQLSRIRENVWSSRSMFMFDTYADELIQLFRDCMDRPSQEYQVSQHQLERHNEVI